MKNITKYFKELLKQDDDIGGIYCSLFNIKSDLELEEDLNYLYTLYKGIDDFWKENSINQWFAIWHKSIRQTNYFYNSYTEVKIELTTEEEKSEFKFLKYKVHEEGFSKKDNINGVEKFNDTYRRYLKLDSIFERENVKVNIGGHLDSILWNLIWMDKHDVLYQTFLDTFLEMEKTKKITL